MAQAEVTVTVLDKTHVPLLHPLDQAAVQGINLKLSFFDACWINLPPVQRLLLFQNTNLPSVPTLMRSLKSALSATLQNYFVLAGKLIYVPSTGDGVIDCSPSAVGSGVAFVEAEADGDINRLIREEKHDLEAFRQLVPELDTGSLPAPVLSVQIVTAFKSGGVAVAFSIHHAAVDGRGIWQFISEWSKAARQANTPSEAAAHDELPIFDRNFLRHPREEEVAREILRRRAPNLPDATLQRPFFEGRFELERSTFAPGLHQINSLKEKIVQPISHSNASLLVAPSSFAAMASHLWVSYVRCHNFNPADNTYITIPADCRSHLKSPISERYFGNCIKGFAAVSTVGTLMQDDGLSYASVAIQGAVKQSVEDALSGTEDWLDRLIELPSEMMVRLAASPRFRVYDTDFGWGKPSHVELVSMNIVGEIAVVGGKDGGDMQVSVCLDHLCFDEFKSHFESI